jgi:carboxypeptidase D
MRRRRAAGTAYLAAAVGLLALPATAQYHTYDEIGPELLAAETNYPDICKRHDLGLSVQGRHLWALRISDNMPLEEDEPEVRYISTMHGDEIMGVEMCLNMIDYLTTNYGTDARVTNIVDEIDLWIMPLMNPDGFVAVSRNNSHNVNLNRNFPDPFTSPNNTTAGREPETATVMNWSFGQSFTLAANFHGGALVANYPFDNNESGSSVYTPSPDDDLFIWISEEYSRHNTPMWNSSIFYHGITNGADWYAISGGMQDWTYRYMGGNEVTLEIGDKMPPASQIPTYWNNNRESMLAYIETSLIGVRGLVTDAQTGAPLAATVVVTDRDHDSYTDPDIGDYHRMLMPGTYELMFSATGYDPATVSGVVVSTGDATRLDVSLWSTTVTFPNGGEVLAPAASTSVTWTGDPSAAFQVQYTANADDITTTTDGFESGTLDEAYDTGGQGTWSVTSSDSHDGLYAARSGSITHNQTTWMTRTVPEGTISFWYRVSSEDGWDFFNFYINGNRVLHVSGTGGGWTPFETVLPTGSHELKWEYQKDGSVSEGSDAAWIDDVQLANDNTVWYDVIALTPVGATSTSWTPPAEGGSYKVRVRSFDDVDTYGSWDESDGVFAVVQQAIPAASEWGLVVMALALGVAATLVLERRRDVRPCREIEAVRYRTDRKGQ